MENFAEALLKGLKALVHATDFIYLRIILNVILYEKLHETSKKFLSLQIDRLTCNQLALDFGAKTSALRLLMQSMFTIMPSGSL